MSVRLGQLIAPASRHVIETLEWDCRFASKEMAWAQQERLSRFLNGPGLRVMIEQFDRISPATEVWCIDRLEVDMGRLDAKASFEQWSAQLEEQLWTSLQRHRAAARAGSGRRSHVAEKPDTSSTTPASALLSPSERDLDVFMHYLQQGHLPWSANQVVARDLADWLARMALHHGLRLWQRLQQAQPSEQVLQRLCHISPHRGLQALLAVRHPDLAASLLLLDNQLLAPLHASGRISAYQMSQLQQRYRVAGLHALWGLSGSALSAARHQALQQALVQAHRDWLAPSWNPAWRSSLGRTPPQAAGSAAGGELARVLLQALLGEGTDATLEAPVAQTSGQWSEQVLADVSHLRSVLDGSRPLDSVRLGELLDRLQSLQGEAQVRLGQALRLLARNKALRLGWARQLGAMHAWRLIQLMQYAQTGPLSGEAAAQLEHSNAGQMQRPLQAAWMASSSWAESLRQFALRMNASAPGTARPGLSRLQSQLWRHSLRHLAQNGRLPQDHVAWQALWQQAWSAMHGETPRLVPMQRPGHVADPVAALQLHLLEDSFRQVAVPDVFGTDRRRPPHVVFGAPDALQHGEASWHASWRTWRTGPDGPDVALSSQRATQALRAELKSRAWHRPWRWHVAKNWSVPRKIELLRLLHPGPTMERGEDPAWSWLPDAAQNPHRLDAFADAPARLPESAWLWAAAIEWAVQQPPGKHPDARGVQTHWAKQWRALQEAEVRRSPRRPEDEASGARAHAGSISRSRLCDANSRWQLVTTATNATLLECMGSCVGCSTSQLSWFEAAMQGAARLGAQAMTSAPPPAEEPWARALLWSFSLGLMAHEALPTAGHGETQDARRIERAAMSHWPALLGLISHALPAWWRQNPSRRQADSNPDTQGRLLADLRWRSARYLAARRWSIAAPGGPQEQIEACHRALLRMWPRWTRAWLAEAERAMPPGVDRHLQAERPDAHTAALDELLARPVATLQASERLQLAELMQTEAGCERWLSTHDEAQRWAWLRAHLGSRAATLKQCSEPLLVALRMTCPQLTDQQAHGLHWQNLAQHLFVEGLPPDPGLLARRYAMRLCQRDFELAGRAGQSWQRWLHRMGQALTQSQATGRSQRDLGAASTRPGASLKTLAAMQAALLAPPLACEQWESSLSKAQRADPLSQLAAVASRPALPPQADLKPSLVVSGQLPVYTPTAGLVLLGGYVQRVFAALKLTANSTFVDEAARVRAVHCLEYLAWGTTQGTEPDWVLSKMLCGIPLAQPLPPCEGLDAATCDLLDSLLSAVIEHWKTIGNTSISGLRQSFLQRSGRLTRKESDLPDQWQLTVEPRAFDMLLDRLPWSYSTIKMPWMAGALHVDWR